MSFLILLGIIAGLAAYAYAAGKRKGSHSGYFVGHLHGSRRRRRMR
ncbi:MAG: hypothetical protein ACLQUT_01000 [Thermoleophilia bacterium]